MFLKDNPHLVTVTKKTTGPKAKPWQGAEMLSVYTWFGLKCGTYTRPTITWQANKLKKNKINSRTQVNDKYNKCTGSQDGQKKRKKEAKFLKST